MSRSEGGAGLSGHVPSRSNVGFSTIFFRFRKRRSVPDIRRAASFGCSFAWKLVVGAWHTFGMADKRRSTEAVLER